MSKFVVKILSLYIDKITLLNYNKNIQSRKVLNIMKKKSLFSVAIILLFFTSLSLKVKAATPETIDGVTDYVNSTDEVYSDLFKEIFTHYRSVIEFKNGFAPTVSQETYILPVSNKVQVTDTHTTSLTLRKNKVLTTGSRFFVGFDSSKANSSYAFSIMNSLLSSKQFPSSNTKDSLFNFSVNGISSGIYSPNSFFDDINDVYTVTNITNRVGQYAQLYRTGYYVKRYVTLRKDKRKSNGNFELYSEFTCYLYIFVTSNNYLVNWTFE